MVEIIVDLMVVSVLAVLIPLGFFAALEIALVLGPWLYAHTPGWALCLGSGFWLYLARPTGKGDL